MTMNVADHRKHDEASDQLSRILAGMDKREFSIVPNGFAQMFYNIFGVIGATPDATLSFELRLGDRVVSFKKEKGGPIVATHND